MAVLSDPTNLPIPGDVVKRVEYGIDLRAPMKTQGKLGEPHEREEIIPNKPGPISEEEAFDLFEKAERVPKIDGCTVHFESGRRSFSHTTRGPRTKEDAKEWFDLFSEGTFVIHSDYIHEDGSPTKQYLHLMLILGDLEDFEYISETHREKDHAKKMLSRMKSYGREEGLRESHEESEDA